MSFNAAIVVATFIVATAAIVLLIVMASRKRAAKEDELKRDASTRGWDFESTSDRGYRVHRWSGTTEGVPWRAESLYYPSTNKQRRPNLARWHGDWNPGINAPVLFMAVPNGKELHSTQMTSADSFFGKLAQKAVGFAFDKAVDGYFGADLGKEVDAGAMLRVETQLPGFIVMAANKDEGARLLSQDLERSLASAAHDPSSIFSAEDKPWLLFRPKGISLARTREFRDNNEIDGFIRAGVALTRGSKFARPFA
jgi:hypothetical protein